MIFQKMVSPDILLFQVLLGGEVEFNCSVEYLADITELSLWWIKDGTNISQEAGKYSIEVHIPPPPLYLP